MMSTLTSSPRRRLLAGLVAGALLLALGVYAGLRSPWGAKHAQVLPGVAMKANDENGLVLFDADDGTQVDFYVESIHWESGNSSGDGHPPCLRRPGEKAEVEVGVLRVAGPGGGWRHEAVWVVCP